MKKRRVNFRSFLSIALMQITAIFLARLSLTHFTAAVIIAGVGFAAAVAAMLVLWRKSRPAVTLTVGFGLVLSLFCFGYYRFANRPPVNDYEGGFCVVEGKVDLISHRDGTYMFLTDLKLNGEEADGKMYAYVEADDFNAYAIETGYRVYFEAEIKRRDADPVFGIGANKRDKCNFEVYVDAGDIACSYEKPTLGQRFRAFLLNKLEAGTGVYGRLAYGILTGDINFLNIFIEHNFRVAGIAHVLAVSGLHIGVMSMLLCWILDKIKVNKKINFIVLTLFLGAYALLVFSPSVLRAFLMGEIGMLAILTGRRRDGLNTLGLAAAVVLTLSPSELFNVGFQMSFTAVLGLMLLSPPLERFFKKIKLGKLSGTLAGVIAAQIGVFPAMSSAFYMLTPYSLVVNFLVLPLFSAAFVLLIVGLFLSALIPPLKVIMYPAGLFLYGVDKLTAFVAGLPGAWVVAYAETAVLSLLVLFFVFSRFVRGGTVKRTICLGLTPIILIAAYLPPVLIRPDNVVIPAESYYEVTSVVVEDGKVAIVGDMPSYGALVNIMKKYKLSRVDEMYLTHMELDDNDNLAHFAMTFKPDTVYCPIENTLITTIGERVGVEITSFTYYELLDTRLRPVYIDNTFIGYDFCPEKKLLFVCGEVKSLPQRISGEYDVIRSRVYLGGKALYITNFAGENDGKNVCSVNEKEISLYRFAGGEIEK